MHSEILDLFCILLELSFISLDCKMNQHYSIVATVDWVIEYARGMF